MLVLLLPVAAVLVGGCAYLIVSMIAPPTRVARWLALWIVVWAEIVLTVELLSLFDAVTPLGFLLCYLGSGAIVLAVWNRRGRPTMRLLTLPSRRQVIEAFRAHPALGVLLLAVMGCALVNLVVALAVPVTNADALTYHLTRVGYWIQHGSTDHFLTNNVRQNAYPPNSEFGLLSTIIFARAEWPAPLGQYAAYLVCLAAVYFVARRLGASNAASLFAALLVGTMPEMILQVTIPKNDLIVASFLICSVAFLLCGLGARAKPNDAVGNGTWASALVVSAIAVGLAVGTKFTALFFLPGLAVAGMVLTFTSASKDRIRRGVLWTVCCAVCVVLLGSINYVRNQATYGLPTGHKCSRQRLGVRRPMLRTTVSNLARYGYFLCDFSGLLPPRLARRLTALRAQLAPPVYRALRIPINGPEINTGKAPFPVDEETGLFDTRPRLDESYAWFGPIAFFVGLPLVLIHLLWSPWRRRWIAFSLALMPALYWIVQSSALRYDSWRGRFFVTVVVTAGPLLAFAYLRGRSRVFKHATTWLLVLIGLSTILSATANNPAKPLYPDLQAFDIPYNHRRRRGTGVLDSTLRRHFPQDVRVGLLTPPTEAEWLLFGRRLRRQLIHLEFDPGRVAEAVSNGEVDLAVIRRSVPLEKVAPIFGERPLRFALRNGRDMTWRDQVTARWWSFIVPDPEPIGTFFPARNWEPTNELWFGCDQVFVPTRPLPAGTVRLQIEVGEHVQRGVLAFDVYAGERLVETIALRGTTRAERAIPWPGATDGAGCLLRIVVSSPDEALNNELRGTANVYRLVELPEHTAASPAGPDTGPAEGTTTTEALE